MLSRVRSNAGEAVRIMTGAPVPPGADAVEKIEVIRVLDEGLIEFESPVKPGQFITPRGIEARAGAVVVKSGERVTPAVSAALASFGCARLMVSRKPRLTLLSTGTELVEVEERPGPSQIRNSNTYSLAGYAETAGAEVLSAGIAPDDFDATRAAIAEALSNSDVVMLSGGVSMGDYDLVKPALGDLGAEILVEKVAMHPGKPTVFAKLGEKIVFRIAGQSGVGRRIVPPVRAARAFEDAGRERSSPAANESLCVATGQRRSASTQPSTGAVGNSRRARRGRTSEMERVVGPGRVYARRLSDRRARRPAEFE